MQGEVQGQHRVRAAPHLKLQAPKLVPHALRHVHDPGQGGAVQRDATRGWWVARALPAQMPGVQCDVACVDGPCQKAALHSTALQGYTRASCVYGMLCG